MKTILLVEDDEDHVVMVERAFKKANIAHHLQVVNNGEEATDYLAGRGRYSSRETHPFPDLVFLDIKMPLQDGHELLHGIRFHAGMSLLPIIVFSDSSRPTDIESAYRLGANSYILKPVRFERLVEILPATILYWLEINTASLK
ncbi:MAG: response regulator receiver protein [Pedosphaera sp.]|nr:response regulator receiver protein [Pedosphaera sp.]